MLLAVAVQRLLDSPGINAGRGLKLHCSKLHIAALTIRPVLMPGVD